MLAHAPLPLVTARHVSVAMKSMVADCGWRSTTETAGCRYASRRASLVPTPEILGLPRRPRLAPQLPATVHRQRFGGDELRGRSGEIDAGLRDVPWRAGAHHRIGARVGGAGLWR